MSTSVKSLGLELPISSHAEISPALIKSVQKNGDVLDSLKDNLRRFSWHNAARAGILATSTASGMFTKPADLTGRFIGYGVAAAGFAELNRRRVNHKTKKSINIKLNSQAELVSETGLQIELIRHSRGRGGKKALDLYWGAEPEVGEDSPNDVRKDLEKIAVLAQKSDLDVVIPASVLDFIEDKEEIAQTVEDPSSVALWLKSIKRLPVTQKGKAGSLDAELEKTVLCLTPEECANLAKLIEIEDVATFEAFTYAWELLRREKPNHVMFRNFASQAHALAATGKRTSIQDQARQQLSNCIANGLDDTTVQRGPNFERIPIALKATISRHDPAIKLQGNHTVDTSIGEQSLHAEDTASLLHAIGIGRLDFEQFFENPGRLPAKKRTQIAEIVMLYKLSDWELPYTPNPENLQAEEQSPTESSDLTSRFSLQLSTALAANMVSKQARQKLSAEVTSESGRISFERFKRGKVMRLVACVAIGFALSREAGQVINMPANLLYDQREARYADNLSRRDINEILKNVNKDSYGFKYSKEEVERLIAEAQKEHSVPMGLYDDFTATTASDAYNQAIMQAYDADQMIEDATKGKGVHFGDQDGIGSSISGDSDVNRTSENGSNQDLSSESGMGNVDTSGGNKPLWSLKSQGLSTEGYWSEATFDELLSSEGGGFYWDRKQRGYDILHSGMKPMPVTLRDSDSISETEEYIEVTSVMPTSYQTTYDQLHSDTFFKSIPVLNGTKPIAVRAAIANADSNKSHPTQADVVQLKNGTFGVVIHDTDYTLSNHKLYLTYWLSPQGEQDLAYSSTHAVKQITGYEDTFNGDSDDYGLSKVDDEINKNVKDLPTDGLTRSQALAKHLQENFTYSTQPFAKVEEKDGYFTTEDQKVDTLPKYIDLVFEKGKANCNVANTLIAADNPGVFNAVTGYRNEPQPNAPYDILSSSDTHMWVADKHGTIVDGTPTKGASEADKEFFKEDFSVDDLTEPKSAYDEQQEREKKIKQAAELVAVIAFAGLLVAKRKKIAAQAKQAHLGAQKLQSSQADKIMSRIIKSQPDRANLAVQIVESALFSGDTVPVIMPTQAASETQLRNTLRISQPSIKKPARFTKKRIDDSVTTGKLTGQDKRTIRLAKKLVRLNFLVHRTGITQTSEINP